MTADDRIAAALEIAGSYGNADGSSHKMWAIDQMVRALTGDQYEATIRGWKAGEDGPETYGWEEGVAP